MSLADEKYISMCKEIINLSGEPQKVRPIWPDTGEHAYTFKVFGICNRYDLRQEFPVITLRPINIKAAFDEILWIFQKKSNNINDLNSHIWDEWADENGSIGKAYGYQIGKKFLHHTEDINNDDEQMKETYPSWDNSVIHTKLGKREVWMDQMDALLYDLKNDPYSRRLIMNMYNHDDLYEMNLHPCAYSTTWNVTDEGYDKPILNMILNQRSQDVLVAGSWNVVQYALLLMMVAQTVDMIPGQLIHMISDAHIYDRHVRIIDELISRETYEAPKVSLDKSVKDFYDFKVSSLIIEDYKAGEQIKNIPVAV